MRVNDDVIAVQGAICEEGKTTMVMNRKRKWMKVEELSTQLSSENLITFLPGAPGPKTRVGLAEKRVSLLKRSQTFMGSLVPLVACIQIWFRLEAFSPPPLPS